MTEYIHKIHFTNRGKFILTILEIFSYLLTIFLSIYIVQDGKIGSPYDFAMIPLIFIGVVISFSNKSYTYDWLISDKFSQLGIFTIYIFLNHYYWARVLSENLTYLSADKRLLIYFILTFITAYVVKLITERFLRLDIIDKIIIRKIE